MSRPVLKALLACEQEVADLPVTLDALVLLAQCASYRDVEGLDPVQCRGLYVMLCDAQARARKVEKAVAAAWAAAGGAI